MLGVRVLHHERGATAAERMRTNCGGESGRVDVDDREKAPSCWVASHLRNRGRVGPKNAHPQGVDMSPGCNPLICRP